MREARGQGGYPLSAHARVATDGNRTEVLVSRWAARRPLKPRAARGARELQVGTVQCALPRVNYGCCPQCARRGRRETQRRVGGRVTTRVTRSAARVDYEGYP